MARMILNETSYFGAGCRKEVVGEMNRRGMKKAFIVSDKDLVKFGVAKKVTDVLDGAGIAYELFDDVKANPTIHNVQCGLEAFKKAKADVIIAIGGGSVMDTAKAIGIIAENPGFADVKSLEGTADTKHKSFPMIAFATTSGTAAEVTINYVITDEEAGRKLVCIDPNDIPMIAFNDAEMLMSMPKGLTAATGMDHDDLERDQVHRGQPRNGRQGRVERRGARGDGLRFLRRRHGVLQCRAGHRAFDGASARRAL